MTTEPIDTKIERAHQRLNVLPEFWILEELERASRRAAARERYERDIRAQELLRILDL